MLAEYIAMVAAVSKEPAHVVEWEIPVAKGLQYQAIYLQLKDLNPTAASASSAASDWRQIAGV